MSNGKNREMKLPSFDELFSSQEERNDAKLKRIYEIPLEKIDPFPNHPYKVRNDEDMENLVESIKAHGVMTPAAVRKKEDGRYELISGHRRKRACELLGIPYLRCEVLDMSRDEAVVMMVESNYQRSTILPSEKAFAYKMRLDAMNRQGRRTDLTYSPMDKKIRSGKDLSKHVGDSQAQIYRYIRLTELIPELLDMVDEGKIALRPAVELSYIPKLQQGEIWQSMVYEDCTPSHAQTIRLRNLSEENELSPALINEILSEPKSNQKAKLSIKLDQIINLFPKNLPEDKREAYVAEAMKYYKEHRERQIDRER